MYNIIVNLYVTLKSVHVQDLNMYDIIVNHDVSLQSVHVQDLNIGIGR